MEKKKVIRCFFFYLVGVFAWFQHICQPNTHTNNLWLVVVVVGFLFLFHHQLVTINHGHDEDGIEIFFFFGFFLRIFNFFSILAFFMVPIMSRYNDNIRFFLKKKTVNFTKKKMKNKQDFFFLFHIWNTQDIKNSGLSYSWNFFFFFFFFFFLFIQLNDSNIFETPMYVFIIKGGRQEQAYRIFRNNFNALSMHELAFRLAPSSSYFQLHKTEMNEILELQNFQSVHIFSA